MDKSSVFVFCFFLTNSREKDKLTNPKPRPVGLVYQYSLYLAPWTENSS